MAITRLGPNQDITAAKIAGQINFKNLIINGDMSIAQRDTSVSGITSTSYNTLDRFRTGVSGFGTWTQSQDTDVPTGQGFANSLKMDCTTASGPDAAGSVLYLVQYIEAQNLQQLKFGTSNAESTTISFWVKTNVTGTYTVEIVSSDSGRHICGTYTVNASNTWEKKTITFEGDTTGTINNDNGRGFEVFFWLGAGSEFTSGTLATSWATSSAGNRVSSSQANLATSTDNNFWITGVQLEAGTSASDFEFLPYDVNLMRCYRYCVNIIKGNQEDGPANEPIAIGKIGNPDEFNTIVRLPTEMRANPSLVTNSISGNFYIGAGGSGGLVDSIGSGESLRQTIELYKASTGYSLPQGYAATILTANSNSILRAEAEL